MVFVSIYIFDAQQKWEIEFYQYFHDNIFNSVYHPSLSRKEQKEIPHANSHLLIKGMLIQLVFLHSMGSLYNFQAK